ncbi:hypothetical protein CCACVL1_16918 [Corchorus capsularis]|uniref:Uncharacterized protein n=1 Tax=Corchorus capsularis TaxID=210143 RepID=A0A1R3HV32_COCAP|nr:hypothetical protein CCACVL1_16918 [Corchorus capsularis]
MEFGRNKAQKEELEICVELLKLAIDFVVVVAEAVGVVIQQSERTPPMIAAASGRSISTPVPFVGFLP